MLILPELKFLYKNYKGVISWRTVQDPKVEYKYSKHHSKGNEDLVWIMRAYDVEKEDFRDFAMQDIIAFMSKEGY